MLSERLPRIGVVGYYSQRFEVNVALNYVKAAFDHFEREFQTDRLCIVSGLTKKGIPGVAYEEAKIRNYYLVGVVCSKADMSEAFPVDDIIVEGENWGDESNRFIQEIDVLVKIGGGKQSYRELLLARSKNITIMQYELRSE